MNISSKEGMNVKKIVLMGIPHHGNIGDGAIAFAEKKFLEDNVKDYEIYCVPEETMEKCAEKLLPIITKDDIIMFHGGGNIGCQYPLTERARRKIIQLFPNNKIIIFPQTIFFKDDENGRREFEITKKVYNSHKNLTIIAREEASYQIMKKAFKNNKVFLTPDIVMYLNETQKPYPREGALVILRDDAEANITKEERKQLEEIVRKNFNEVIYSDNLNENGQPILEINREEILAKTFHKFRSAQMVLTDRLHGMVFSAITSTPCVAVGNYNHKVKYTAEWLKEFEYIKYIESINDASKAIESLKEMKSSDYHNAFAIPHFNKIAEAIYEL